MDTSNYNLNVYITHFTPPKRKRTDWIKYFITSRANFGYLRSWARLLKHQTRGNQPWKKDVMTSVRAKDYKNRYKYLSEVLDELNKINVKKININIFSNSSEVKIELAKLGHQKNLQFYFYEKYSKMNIIHNSPWVYNNIQSPWLLTWEHKKIMLNDIKKADKSSLFLYIENDMKFTQKNLDYWINAREKLKETKLVPSFIRVEFSNIRNEWLAIDHFGGSPSNFSDLPKFESEQNIFIQLPNPYCAAFLLDFTLAIEYSNSKAFTEKDSREISGWDIGARAAMGLQFVDIPENFTSRHIILIEKAGDYCEISDASILHHLPNLYCQVIQLEKNYLPINRVVLNK
jgi:archaellum component FlaF (FlaF/FlaG flagellin family)